MFIFQGSNSNEIASAGVTSSTHDFAYMLEKIVSKNHLTKSFGKLGRFSRIFYTTMVEPKNIPF